MLLKSQKIIERYFGKLINSLIVFLTGLVGKLNGTNGSRKIGEREGDRERERDRDRERERERGCILLSIVRHVWNKYFALKTRRAFFGDKGVILVRAVGPTESDERQQEGIQRNKKKVNTVELYKLITTLSQIDSEKKITNNKKNNKNNNNTNQ
jgi:hypothetical protein